MTPGRLPAALRAVLEAELAAGNEILDTGCTFPAPPVGGWVMLARVMTTPVGEGLRYYERNGAQYFSELTDAQGHYWILTAPREPEPRPAMEEIRERRRPWEAAPKVAVPYTVRVDYRGEQVEYREPGRSTWAVFTYWGGEAVLAAATVQKWCCGSGEPAAPMTAEEIATVVGRMAEHLRLREGIGNLRVDRGE
jgi:hypothetical protein